MTASRIEAADTAALQCMLERALHYAPEYAGGMSNHLPMALTALQRLGASAARLQAFEAAYAPRLVPSTAAHQGSGPTLVQTPVLTPVPPLTLALPTLLPRVGAAAFHGLIRTAYAVEAGLASELAAALAYWTYCASHSRPLASDLPAAGSQPVEDWAAGLQARLAGWRSDQTSIYGRMCDAAATPLFSAHIDGLQLAPDTLQRLSALAAERYLQSRNFTVLHLLTSCHALRLLMPSTETPDLMLRWYALAYAAGLVASGTRPAGATAARPQPWGDVIARAIASDNDHVVKLVYTCREEAAHYADDRYRCVATLATRQ